MYWLFKFFQNKTVCHVCDRIIFDSNSFIYSNIPFCKKHYDFILNNQWQIEKSIDSSSESPEKLVELWDYHQKLYRKHKIITFITHEYFEQQGTIFTKSFLWTIKKGA
jgi:acid phosphatase class B